MVIVRVRVGCRSDVSADRPVVADSADALVGYTRRADDDARLLGDCLFTVEVCGNRLFEPIPSRFNDFIPIPIPLPFPSET